MTALAGNLADIFLASGTPAAFTDEACTNSGDDTRYFITDDAKRHWDDGTTVVVEIDTGGGFGIVPDTDYTIEHAHGNIVFNSPNAPSDDVRVDGAFFTTTQVAQAFEWNVDLSADMLEATDFGDTFKVKITGLKDWTAGSTIRWLDEAHFDELVSGSKAVLVLYPNFVNTNSDRYVGYALLMGDTVSSAVDSLVEESISFEGVGDLFYDEG